MIDLLKIRIPLLGHSPSVVVFDDGDAHCSIEYYSKTDSLLVNRQTQHDDGRECTLYEGGTYEQLPSSHSGISAVLRVRGDTHYRWPFLEVKFSPAKILQGHNVFGPDIARLGWHECIGTLMRVWPTLTSHLDWRNATVLQLDVTYSARFETRSAVHMARRALENAGCRHVRRTQSYDSSLMFNSGSEHSTLKVYEKGPEVERELKRMLSKKHPTEMEQNKISGLQSALDYSQNLLRFEAAVKRRKLAKLGYPCNIWELIKYEGNNPTRYNDLWQICFKPIFDSLKGDVMDPTDDENVLKLLSDKYKPSTYRAVRGFYSELRMRGFDAVKKDYPKATFYDNLKRLRGIGLSRTDIQNMGPDNKNNVVPIVRFIDLDFSNQYPADYKEPKLVHGNVLLDLVI